MSTKISLFLLCIALISCSRDQQYNSASDKKEVIAAVEDFYSKYENEDIAFVDYYRDDVIRMGTDGNVSVGNESFRKKWEERIENDTFELISYSKPKILYGKEQSVSYNTFDEIFIDPETQDTTRATGTWIGIWQKQSSGEWKIRMSTWHSK